MIQKIQLCSSISLTAVFLMVRPAACTDSPEPAKERALGDESPTLTELPLLRVSSFPDNKYRVSQDKDEQVASNLSEWQAIWNNFEQQEARSMSLPEVDFSRYRVAMVSWAAGNGGISITVTNVNESNDDFIIHYRKCTQGSYVHLTVLSDVHDAVLIPLSDKPIRFVRANEIEPCGDGSDHQ